MSDAAVACLTGQISAAVSAAEVWQSVLPSRPEVRTARRRLHAKATAILALVAVSYWVLVLGDVPLVLRILAALALVAGLIAVGTGIMHDANHGSFAQHRWANRVAAYSLDALGASSWLWRFQHNVLHHGNTNVAGEDTDIELSPFARLTPSQPWRPWHRAQHIYIWPLYGFLTLKNLLVSDLATVLSGRMDGHPLRETVRPSVVARMTVGKLFHLGWAVVVPLLLHPWWVVLTFYVACSWLVGFFLAVTFQLAHCVDQAEFPADDSPRRGDAFVTHQLRTTVDIACTTPVLGPIYRWLVGGLDHQIEHHLAPRLPHTVYARVAGRFRPACLAHGIEHREHPSLWAAISSHARWLRTMGRPPIGHEG